MQDPTRPDLDVESTIPLLPRHGRHGCVPEDHCHVDHAFDGFFGADGGKNWGDGISVAGIGFDDFQSDSIFGIQAVMERLCFRGGDTGSRYRVEGCSAVVNKPRKGVAAQPSEAADDDICALGSEEPHWRAIDGDMYHTLEILVEEDNWVLGFQGSFKSCFVAFERKALRF